MVKIELDVSKRFMALFGVTILLLGLFAVSYAGNGEFNLPLAWIIGNNGQSVDSDNNGVIDNSDKLTGLTAADLSAVGTTGGGKVYPVVVASNTGSCPAGYDYFSYSQLAGENGYLYLMSSSDRFYFGGLYQWYGGDANDPDYLMYQYSTYTGKNSGFCVKFIVS